MSETATPRAEVLRTRDFVGWAVTGRDGANVGTVSDILIDRQGMVRFLAVDRGFFRKSALVPVEALEWGEGSLRAHWTDPEMRSLPPYDPDIPLTAGVLDELRRAYPRYYRTGGPPAPPIDPAEQRVVPLKEARDFRLAKGAPNLRGWTLYGSDHDKVGTVTDMLVDSAAMKVAYVEVELARDLFTLGGDRRVLVPMEAIELRERSEDAWVRGLTAREVAGLPAHMGGPVDPLVEEGVLEAFSRHGGGASHVAPAEDETVLIPPRDTPLFAPAADRPAEAPADVIAPPIPPPPHVLDDAPPPLPPEPSGAPERAETVYEPPAAAPPPLPSSGVPGDAPGAVDESGRPLEREGEEPPPYRPWGR